MWTPSETSASIAAGAPRRYDMYGSKALSNNELIQRYFRCLDTEDWDGMRELWHADGTMRAVGARPRAGIDDVIDFFAGLFDPWAPHEDKPTRLITDGETIVAEVTFTGTTADGRKVSFDAIDVFDIVDARIKALSNWYDLAQVRRVLAEGAQAGSPAR
jgi:ketosteroid isomerase-like protein